MPETKSKDKQIKTKKIFAIEMTRHWQPHYTNSVYESKRGKPNILIQKLASEREQKMKWRWPFNI